MGTEHHGPAPPVGRLTASDGPDLTELVEPVRQRFVVRHRAREAAYGASRDAVRAAANAIRAIHRGEDDRASALISESRGALDAAMSAVADHPDVLHGGFIQDAAKEHAEAVVTTAVVRGDGWPTAEEVGVDDASWLLGLAESVGELRRRCLDEIRAEHLEEAERLLGLMDEVLAALATIDVPDALTRGLRRAADAARAITERTRGDLTAALGQRRLRAALDAHREALEQASGG